ncbi:MAG: hypothetical protein LBI53_03430 [Candidatus Peribacteria bacterium]|jgi:uncharacterized protein YydD (DUF2326 family)|nr:hypothetical protein [Candidatus Peribacteria bacterium]
MSQENSKTRSHKKTNGVGKSMAIETIRFCLFQDFKFSRLSKIPKNLIKNEEFCLDLNINNKPLTIIRNIENEKAPIIFIDKEYINFFKLEDACDFLLSLIFDSNIIPSISFRQLLAPLMREEECDFKEVTKYYRDKFSPFEAMKPQAYFF